MFQFGMETPRYTNFVYGNNSLEDIWYKDELDYYAATYPEFRVHYFLEVRRRISPADEPLYLIPKL
jgi:NAD(P)H-flavin reductase